jgi:hypothetical protein
MPSEKEYRKEVKKLLREAGAEETELNIAVEKIFDFANIVFEKWMAQKKQNYEKRNI